MSIPFDIDTVVIGACVAGLAGARAVQGGAQVLVMEQAERAGEGISSRNSGVIHAVLYYDTGSLKARLYVRGRDLMYEFCARRNVPHRRCGKSVVTKRTQELPRLEALVAQPVANGVVAHWIDGTEAQRREGVGK